MTGQPFERIALIGCGLIGSSVARAVRERGLARHLAIYDLSPKVRDRVRITVGLEPHNRALMAALQDFMSHKD